MGLAKEKAVVAFLIKSLLDFFFPPLCIHCGEHTSISYFCKRCWEENALIEPVCRCIHCFVEIEELSGLCSKCKKDPVLPFQRAALFEREAPIAEILGEDIALGIAGLAFWQWARLDWEDPTQISVIPQNNLGIGRAFASFFGKECTRFLRRVISFDKTIWELRSSLGLEDATLLLLDTGCTVQERQNIAQTVLSAFPKKVYILSLTL